MEIDFTDVKLLSSMTASRCSLCLCLVLRGDEEAHRNFHNYRTPTVPPAAQDAIDKSADESA